MDDDHVRVCNHLVDDTIIADAYAILVLGPLELPMIRRKWLRCECIDGFRDPRDGLRVEYHAGRAGHETHVELSIASMAHSFAYRMR